jgi:hypothetical protein
MMKLINELELLAERVEDDDVDLIFEAIAVIQQLSKSMERSQKQIDALKAER